MELINNMSVNENGNPSNTNDRSPEDILKAVREERMASSGDTAGTSSAAGKKSKKKIKTKAEKGESHGFFKFIFSLNLLADAAMCIYSAYISKAPAVTVGMAVLALCFLIVIPGLILLRLSVRRSSAAMASAAYILINLLIGFVFACEFFGFLPEKAGLAEGGAIAVMAALIIITVNILVRRMSDKE